MTENVEAITVILVVIVVIAIIYAHIAWESGRSQSLIDKWAAENDFKVLEKTYCLFKGPFFLTATKGQTVYRVVVRDRTGRVRSGYVKCGGFFFGLFSDAITERWDDD